MDGLKNLIIRSQTKVGEIKMKTNKNNGSGESRYLIITTHTPEQCLNRLDEYVAKAPDLLQEFDWGCKVGDHSGYAVVKAADERAARSMLPSEEERQRDRIIQLNKFTPQEIKELHRTTQAS